MKKHQKLELATKSVKIVKQAGQVRRAGKIPYEKYLSDQDLLRAIRAENI